MNILKKIFSRPGRTVNAADLPTEGAMPEFAGVGPWFNGGPLSAADLKGKVVLVDFWTYSCINCLRTLPYLNAWHRTYAAAGLVVIGVHTPEFEFEKDAGNVEAALKRYGIGYPVALDNDHALWNAYKNRYWPAHYFIDREGKIRFHHFGEGEYEHSEAVIRALLAEKKGAAPMPEAAGPIASDVDLGRIGTPETYLGHGRVEYLGSPEPVLEDAPRRYSVAKNPARNVFYLNGLWEVHEEFTEAKEAGAAIIYNVVASKVNLVLSGPENGGRIEIVCDGKPLNEKNLGKDAALADGRALVTTKEARLYNLLDAPGDYRERSLKLVFLDPGIKAFAFTFS